MDRRQFLVTAGAGAVTPFLAGCSSSGASSNNSPSNSGGGKSYTTDSGLKLTVSDVHLQRQFMADEEIERPPDGMAYVLAKVSVRNTSDSPQTLPRFSAFDFVVNESQYNPVREESYTLENLSRSPGFYKQVADAQPDVESTGWLVFTVPRETATGELAWAGQYTDDSTTWSVSLNPDALPSLDVAVNANPREIELGNSGVLEVAVSNSGTHTGTFHRRFELTHPYAEDEEDVIEIEVPGESSQAWTREVTPRVLGETTLTLSGVEQSATLTTTPATVSWGETWTGPGGVKYTVRDLQFSDMVAGPDTEASAGEGYQYALVHVTIRNTASESRSVGQSDAFSIEASDSSASIVAPFIYYPPDRLSSPVSGSFNALDSRSLPAGAEQSSWVIFRVPNDFSTTDARVRLSTIIRLSDHDVEAVWGDG